MRIFGVSWQMIVGAALLLGVALGIGEWPGTPAGVQTVYSASGVTAK